MNYRMRTIAITLALLFASACSSCGTDDNDGDDNPAGDAGGDMTTEPDAGSPDGGETDPDMGIEPEGNVIACTNEITPPTDGNLCNAEAGSNGFILIQAGDVLAGDDVYENGTVLVDASNGNDRIVCVGCDCAEQAEAADAAVVSCPEGVLSPSLINPHDHITFSLSWPQEHGTERFDHRHDWRRGLRGHTEVGTNPGSDGSREGVLYGETRMLFGGATSIAGSSSADSSGFLRNLDNADLLEGLTGVDVDYRTFPLGDSNGTMEDDTCNYPSVDSESRAASAGIYLPHISEGIDDEAHNEFRCTSGLAEGGVDLIGPNTSVIHGIGLTATDIELMGAEGAKLVWSPRSNIDLYGNTARVPIFKKYGVVIALGTDWSASGSMNVLRELRCADYLNRVHYDGVFSDLEIWKMSTYNAAVAMGADDQIGVIADRYVADLAIFDGRDNQRYRAIIDAETEDVHLVMRGGTPLLGDSNIIEALVPNDEVDQCEEIDVCGERRRICAQRDIGMNLNTLQSSVDANAYPLFFCDEPEREPSCVPFREGEYDGSNAGDGDVDGDGIPDAEDACVSVFNPVRPMDGMDQPDIDGDGEGDECDACPTGEEGSCPMFDPDDFDGDGVPNLEDNCPATSNPDQTDSEGDGVGDACDACPDFDNSESPACPATIYEIRNGDWGTGDTVFIDEVVVTAVGSSAFFVQVPESASYYQGLPFSGLYVYVGSSGSTPATGDIVRIEGTLGEFGDTLELMATSVDVASSGNELPSLTDVEATEVATGGPRAAELEGTLIRLSDVVVTDPNPDAPDDFNEFEVDGALRVDDLLYAVEPDPTGGEEFAFLQGVLTFSFSNSKLLPRGPEDVITGPPSLLGFNVDEVYMEAGSMVSSPTLRIQMTGPTLSDTTVSLSYTGSVSGPGSVVVPAGEDDAEVTLTAAAILGGATGTVTASVDGSMDTVDVVIYDETTARTVTSLAPPNGSVTVNGSLVLTVEIAPPAPSGGQAVAISYDPGAAVSGPASVTVPAGQLSQTFTVNAGASPGNEDVTASIGGSSETASITVSTSSANCLIISEYIEGSGSNNKALELYNCAPGPLDLGNFAVCLVTNAATSCSSTVDLPSTQLAAQDVLTLCRNDVASGGDPVAGIADNCDLVAANVANFNGNDRLVVFEDLDGNSNLDPTDEITDAFGQIAVDPGSIWSNATYRRCDFTPYDGTEPFDVSERYTAHPENDASDFGVAPTEGCP